MVAGEPVGAIGEGGFFRTDSEKIPSARLCVVSYQRRFRELRGAVLLARRLRTRPVSVR